MSIGVAILGGGIFAREEHLPAVKASKALTLKAVYSRSLKSAKSLITDSSNDIVLYSDDSGSGKSLDDLLANEDIRAVIIALPIKNQAEYVRKALKAGKHVLSEKPIAENVAEAVALIKWYEAEIAPRGTTWAVAENVRFNPSFVKAGQISAQKGRLLTFRARQQFFVEPGGKYYETEWRKVPTHQGGFLLDGGVHFTASLRLLLANDTIISLSAFTAQVQGHLPPADTIEATARTKGGAVGSISISVGTTATGVEYNAGRENGSVVVTDEVLRDGDKEEQRGNEGSGVASEVKAWGEALSTGKPNSLQTPQQGLADLEIIEACLRSGEKGARPVELRYQEF